MANGTVGELRQNCALSGADDRVEVVAHSCGPEVRALVERLIVRRSFPDTQSRDGSIRSVLKIELGVVSESALKGKE